MLAKARRGKQRREDVRSSVYKEGIYINATDRFKESLGVMTEVARIAKILHTQDVRITRRIWRWLGSIHEIDLVPILKRFTSGDIADFDELLNRASNARTRLYPPLFKSLKNSDDVS